MRAVSPQQLRAPPRWAGRVAFVLIICVGIASVVPAPYDVVRPLEPIRANELVRPRDLLPRDAATIHAPVLDIHRARWSEVAWYRLTDPDAVRRHARDASASRQQQQAAEDHGHLRPLRLLRESQQVATLLAAQAAGVRSRSAGEGVRVWAVGRNPHDSPLRAGDVVVRYGEHAIDDFGDLRAAVDATSPGARVTVTLKGGRRHRLPPLDVQDGRQSTPAALGMAVVETERPRVRAGRLSWRVPEDVGGTSAGLAFALAAYQALERETIGAGLLVHATGEVSSDGGIYSVGQVADKARAARRAGADILVVAPEDEQAARAVAGGLQIVAARSLDQVVDQVRAAAG